MKKISTIFTVFAISLFSFSNTVLAQAQRWVEFQRIEGKNKINQIENPMYINIDDNGNITLRRGSFAYPVEMEDSTLTMGDIAYQIVKKNDKEIRLKDENEITYVFKLDNKDKSAEDADKFKREHAAPSSVVSSFDRSMIAGKWFAYKRTSRDGGPLQNINFNTMPKTAVVFDKADSLGNEGTMGLAEEGKPMFYIKSIEKGILHLESKDKSLHDFKVLKADGKEWILEGDDGVIYFFNRD